MSLGFLSSSLRAGPPPPRGCLCALRAQSLSQALSDSAEQVNLAELMTMQPVPHQHKEPSQSAGWSFLARKPAPPHPAFLGYKPVCMTSTCSSSGEAFGPERRKWALFCSGYGPWCLLEACFFPRKCPWCQPCSLTEWNIFSHWATPVVNKNLLPVHLSSMQQGVRRESLGHFLSNAGPTAPGKKLHKAHVLVWEVELPCNSCVSTETRRPLGKS